MGRAGEVISGVALVAMAERIVVDGWAGSDSRVRKLRGYVDDSTRDGPLISGIDAMAEAGEGVSIKWPVVVRNSVTLTGGGGGEGETAMAVVSTSKYYTVPKY